MIRHHFKICSILLASVLICISFLFATPVSADKNTTLIADQSVQSSTSKAATSSTTTRSSNENSQTQISGVDGSKTNQDTSTKNTNSAKSSTSVNSSNSTKESTTPSEDSSSQQVTVTVKSTSTANSSATVNANEQAQQSNAQSASSQKTVTLTTPNPKATVKQETVSLSKSVLQPGLRTHFLLTTVINTVSISFFPHVFAAEVFNFLWQPWSYHNIK